MNVRKVYKKDPEVITRQVDNELVIIPLGKEVTVADLGVFHILKNKTAVAVWGLIDGKRDVAAIAGRIARTFKVSAQTAAGDVASFLRALEKIKAIK